MLREVYNPKHKQALENDPTLGTPLFDGVNPRRVPPKTIKRTDTQSVAYRDTVESGRARGMQLRILNLLRRLGPLTMQEIAVHTGIAVHVVSARINELRDDLSEVELAVSKEYPEGKKINPTSRKPNNLWKAK